MRPRRHQPIAWEELSSLTNLVMTLESHYVEKGLELCKSTTLFVVSGAIWMVHENPSELFSLRQIRTHNRIRSPSFTDSSEID